MKNKSQSYIINFQSEITGQLCAQYTLNRKSDRIVLNSSNIKESKIYQISKSRENFYFYFIPLAVLITFSTVKRALNTADLFC